MVFVVGYPSSSKPHPTGLNLRGATKKPSFGMVLISSLCCNVVHELSSVTVYVAGEGVELTIHKESVLE